MTTALSSRQTSPHQSPAPRIAYSVKEVAALTGLCRTTIYGHIGKGNLVSCKIGGRRLIKHAELEKLLSPREHANLFDQLHAEIQTRLKPNDYSM